AGAGAEAPGAVEVIDAAASTSSGRTLTSPSSAVAIGAPVQDENAAHAGENPPFSQNRGPVGPPTVVVNSGSPESTELRSAGQPGPAVPTYPLPVSAGGTSPAVVAAPSAIATGVVDNDRFGEAAPDPVTEIQAVADARVRSNLVLNLAISDIDKNPFQTRYVEDDDALEELAESIKANGVVQPIVVRPAEEAGRCVLILGER